MQKPLSLRSALLKAIPSLSANPDSLSLLVHNGYIASTLAASLSFEKRYPLTIAVNNFTDDLNTLLVPVLAWCRDNQPDIMSGPAETTQGFTWQMQNNADGSFNVTLTLALTERTQVWEEEQQLHAKDLPEPLPAAPVSRPMELYINGELVSRWEE
ncbi:phage tail protein [[Enterobacter] lignolyticus]|uniref:P2 phage tail completion protein R, GpR n=1 Tax=Enterobacter lignolyticus (strain SCF1) TaxID=701347 RepID=E3G777_ENTLS|nr:phage tail protein [[Enterobacter] lignolyticus]ADO47401.1 P2 phage tail completion protein R, GpR [[Enterobacter] lignolyticus SCF1]